MDSCFVNSTKKKLYYFWTIYDGKLNVKYSELLRHAEKKFLVAEFLVGNENDDLRNALKLENVMEHW